MMLCTAVLVWVVTLLIIQSSPAESSLQLTSDISSSNCPLITFTCIAMDFTSENLRWYFDDTNVATYAYEDTDEYPFNVTLSSPIPGVMIQIVQASNNATIYNYHSTNIANLSILIQEGIRNITCGNRATRSAPISTQVLLAPVIAVVPIYNHFLELSELIVQWEEVLYKCSSKGVLEYNIIVKLKNPSGVTVDQNLIEIGSGCGVCMDDECSTPLCSTSFRYDENYSISVTASNTFGSSPPTIFNDSIVSSYSSIFNHTLTFENCMTYVLCSSPINEGGCVIRYGRDPSYKNLGPSVFIPLNTSSSLPDIASSTLYYFTMNVTIGSTSFQVRRTFTTGEDDRLTLSNMILLSIGVVLLFIGITISVVGLILYVLYYHNLTGSMRIISIVFLAIVLLMEVISVILLVALGVHVGASSASSSSTCDVKWRSTRDGLIISMFVFSVVCLVTPLPTVVFVCVREKSREKNEPEKEEEVPFGTVAPQVIVKYNNITKCQVCTKELKSFLNTALSNKNNCSACGKVSCDECSKFSAYLPYKEKEDRVCVTCYNKSLKLDPKHGEGSATNKGMKSVPFGSEAPIMIPEDNAPKCQACDERIFNFMNRRHYCRACGKVVCGGCSGNRAHLPYLGKRESVCNPCYELSKIQAAVDYSSDVPPTDKGNGSHLDEYVIVPDKQQEDQQEYATLNQPLVPENFHNPTYCPTELIQQQQQHQQNYDVTTAANRPQQHQQHGSGAKQSNCHSLSTEQTTL